MTTIYKKNLREAYAAMKEKDWIIKKVDGEQCLYKKITPQVDVEVSGLNNGKIKRYAARVYVWQIDKKVQVIETVRYIEDLEDLKKVLLDVDQRYTKIWAMNH